MEVGQETGIDDRQLDWYLRALKERKLAQLVRRRWIATPAGRARLQEHRARQARPHPLRVKFGQILERRQLEKEVEVLLGEIEVVSDDVDSREGEMEQAGVQNERWDEEAAETRFNLEKLAELAREAQNRGDVGVVRTLLDEEEARLGTVWKAIAGAVEEGRARIRRRQVLEERRRLLQQHRPRTAPPPDWVLEALPVEEDPALFSEFIHFRQFLRHGKPTTPGMWARSVGAFRRAGRAYLKSTVKKARREIRGMAVCTALVLFPCRSPRYVPFLSLPPEDQAFLIRRFEEGDDVSDSVHKVTARWAYNHRITLIRQGWDLQSQWAILTDWYGPPAAQEAMARPLPLWMTPSSLPVNQW